MRPGEGTVSILLVGRLMGERSEGVWPTTAAVEAERKAQERRKNERVTKPPRRTASGMRKTKEVMSVIQLCVNGQSRGNESKVAGPERPGTTVELRSTGQPGGRCPDMFIYRPEALVVGRSDSWASDSSGCTLWRTSEPCTQKITSSAILVACRPRAPDCELPGARPVPGERFPGGRSWS